MVSGVSGVSGDLTRSYLQCIFFNFDIIQNLYYGDSEKSQDLGVLKSSKPENSSPFCPYLFILAKNRHFDEKLRFGFLIFFRFWVLSGVILGKIQPKYGTLHFLIKLTPAMAQNQKIFKIQITSSLCIPKCQFSAKNEEIQKNINKFYCLEAHFQLTPTPHP